MEITTTTGALKIKGLKPGYRQDVAQFNRWAAGRPVSQDLIEEYFISLRDAGKSVSTIQRHKAALKSALRALAGSRASIGAIAQLDAFFSTIKTGQRDPSIAIEKCLSRGELAELLKVSGYRTSLFIRALFATACRVSELVNIRTDDCTAAAGGIRIKVLGKGSKEGEVFMPVDLFEEIRSTWTRGEYLFGNGPGPISRFSIRTMIKRAGTKIGRPDIGPHTLRHSWASCAINTLGLAKTSKYLRHATTDITAKAYIHGRASMSEILANNIIALQE